MFENRFTSTRTVFDPGLALSDIVAGARRPALWIAFASDEIQQRYRRSRLGFAWIVISYVIFVGTISLFFGNFSELGHKYFTVYVAVNFAIFMFLMGNITDGCAVFRVAKTWIKSAPLPHSIYVFKSIARSLFVFGINLLVAIGILYLFEYSLHPVALLAIPAFLVLLINAVFVQTTFGYIAARYPDVDHLMQSLMRILYFTTPVLWVRDEHTAPGLRTTISELNPFTHALEIFASPIMGKMPDPKSWIIMGILTVVMFVATICVTAVAHRRLPYWI